jgi:type II secretory pathway pseudopilin PulG
MGKAGARADHSFHMKRSPSRQQSTRGFTLVEIAIALGVIGFALVAIIGILPAGLQIQRDNRAETIINQDGTLWLEAIRNGARGLDELMDHVESIEIRDTVTGTIINSYANGAGFTTGSNIIGLLTTPAGRPNTEARAVVTAISGAAAEKSSSAVDRELAFRYQMTVQVERPGINHAPPFTALSAGANPAPPIDPLDSLYELRLDLAYNWVNDKQPGTRHQTYRSTISRKVLAVSNQVPELYFFVP